MESLLGIVSANLSKKEKKTLCEHKTIVETHRTAAQKLSVKDLFFLFLMTEDGLFSCSGAIVGPMPKALREGSFEFSCTQMCPWAKENTRESESEKQREREKGKTRCFGENFGAKSSLTLIASSVETPWSGILS